MLLQLWFDWDILLSLCRSNLAKGFGLLNLAWGIGAVMGPVVSGLLAQPCVQYKLQHCPDFLVKYPFLLPCIGAAIFSVAGTIAALSLIETNPRCRKVIYSRSLSLSLSLRLYLAFWLVHIEWTVIWSSLFHLAHASVVIAAWEVTTWSTNISKLLAFLSVVLLGDDQLQHELDHSVIYSYFPKIINTFKL
jgi:hypothetical protein